MIKRKKQKGIPHTADMRVRLLYLFTAMLVFMFAFSPTAFAGSTSSGSISETEDQYADQTMPDYVVPSDFKSNFNFNIYIFYETVYSGDLMMTGMSGQSSVANYVFLDLDDEDNILTKCWSAIKSAYGYTSTIGVSFVLLYFFIEMIEKSTLDNFSTDSFVRMLLKLIIGVILVTMGPDLVEQVVKIGTAFYSDISGVMNGSSGTPTTNVVLKNAYFTLKDATIWSGIGYMLAILTPALFITLAKIGFTAVAMGRVIELSIRMLFAPIGMANIYNNGSNAPGIRYMKKLLAVSLQGVLIFLVIILYSTLLGTGLNLVKSVAMTFVAVGAAAKSQSVANDIVGV